jgi:hypothetical protein
MDIMNNMTVSTSKLTFSLIAISALLISGSGFILQDAYAADAPEFTALHINETATKITFDQNVNGTLRVLDWSIRMNSTALAVGDNLTNVIGSDGTVISITNIVNGTTSGVSIGDAHAFTAYSDTSTAANNAQSGAGGFGLINNSKIIVLIHDAIDTDGSYFINYTGNPALNNNVLDSGSLSHTLQGGLGFGATAAENASLKYVKIGSNATAVDWMAPGVLSGEILKSNPKQLKILMSEDIANVNGTLSGFTLTKTGGDGFSNAAVPATIESTNNTKFILIDLQNPAKVNEVFTLSYNNHIDTSTAYLGSWITDAINSERHGATAATGLGGGSAKPTGTENDGVGNRMGNFTVSITNWLEIGMYGDVTTCYDCAAPTVTKVEVSLDSSTPITVNDDNKVHINAGIDDTVSVMVTVADNLGADTIPFAGLYTNFGETPDNLYYSNNFDSAKQMSTSYYEWNVRGDDVAFDNNGAITWTDATAKVNPDRTQTFTYTMTINDEIESSQVWVDIGDKVGNYAKISLPITLEVSGAPGITFASDDSQKVVSFFNESILLAIVSQWTATSSDDASNVEQLSSVLGIESQLPTWTTDLASWVADDKIDVADMIVAVEYVINQ